MPNLSPPHLMWEGFFPAHLTYLCGSLLNQLSPVSQNRAGSKGTLLTAFWSSFPLLKVRDSDSIPLCGSSLEIVPSSLLPKTATKEYPLCFWALLFLVPSLLTSCFTVPCLLGSSQLEFVFVSPFLELLLKREDGMLIMGYHIQMGKPPSFLRNLFLH